MKTQPMRDYRTCNMHRYVGSLKIEFSGLPLWAACQAMMELQHIGYLPC